jgi:5'-deoxynucleotidase YfbR-like HD superfamily hydrolase
MKTWTGVHAPIEGDGEVNILDLIIQLGRQLRFNGFGDKEYTVLHHSMLVSLIWLRMGYDPAKLVYVLVHDCHEAYTGDIPSPIKTAIGNLVGDVENPISQLEEQIDKRILQHLNLPEPDDDIRMKVRTCDKLALLLESWFFGPPEIAMDLFGKYSIDDQKHIRRTLESVVPGAARIADRVGQLRHENAEEGHGESLGGDP